MVALEFHRPSRRPVAGSWLLDEVRKDRLRALGQRGRIDPPRPLPLRRRVPLRPVAIAAAVAAAAAGADCFRAEGTIVFSTVRVREKQFCAEGEGRPLMHFANV